MTTASTETVTEHIERCYRSRQFEPLRDLYRDDAVLDATVPQWRFQLQGPDAIVSWYQDVYSQLSDDGTVSVRSVEADGLVVLESELRDGEGEHAVLVREIDVFRVEDGRITTQSHYCPGAWDADTIARQRAEAPMVRPEG